MKRAKVARKARNIRVVLLSGLGDVVHGLPLVNALKDNDPEVHITWVVEPMPSEILRGHPSIDRIVTFNRRNGPRGMRELSKDLHSGQKADISLNLNVYFKSMWPTLVARAPRRIGFDRGRTFDGVSFASNEHLAPKPWAHTADLFMEFAEHLGVAPTTHEWRIDFSDVERAAQSAFFAKFEGRPVATLVPASASVKKDWIPARWATVADSLESDFGFKVVITGGPGAREREIATEIISRSSADIDWAMGDSVRRLAWIIGGSSLVVAPDTGPVHIARALNVPVIGIYGHTNPWRVGPWRAYSDLWVDKYTEPGTRPDPSNRKPKWNVMPTITASDVIEKIEIAAENYGAAKTR